MSLSVGAGEVVGLIGPNGAGKTTLLNTVAGLLVPAAGRVVLDGADDDRDRARSGAEAPGLALVPEHRRIFADFTVAENLRIGGVTLAAAERAEMLEEVVEVFPFLRSRWDSMAGYLSGGEAQQLAIARALMCRPRLLLMDEPSLGLAPVLVDAVAELIAELRDRGRTLLVVEQNASRMLDVADRAYVLRSGAVVGQGAGSGLLAEADLFDTFVRGSARMTELVQNVIDGLGRGSIYALLALGVAVVFGVMHLLNFAHGELITVSGYATYAAFSSGWSWYLVAPLIVVVVGGHQSAHRARSRSAGCGDRRSSHSCSPPSASISWSPPSS